MNQPASGSLTLEKAIEGFVHFKTAEGLSPTTITSYRHDLRRFAKWVKGKPLAEIDSLVLSGYLTWMRTDYRPKRFNGSRKPLTAKTIRNHWASLCSFFRWYSEEFGGPNPMKRVPAPKIESNPPDPFTKEEIQRLLEVCLYSRKAKTRYRESFRMRLPAGARVLPYRSNIPKISEFAFEMVDETYPSRAQREDNLSGHAIVAGENYGQGSSREHAALAPRFLGLRLVLSKSFARIHRKNLVNFGVFPVSFKDPAVFDQIELGDTLVVEDMRGQIERYPEEGAITVRVENKDVTFEVVNDLSSRDIEVLLAGGLTNRIRDEL